MIACPSDITVRLLALVKMINFTPATLLNQLLNLVSLHYLLFFSLIYLELLIAVTTIDSYARPFFWCCIRNLRDTFSRVLFGWGA